MFPFRALGRLTRRTVSARLEVEIAQSAAAASRKHDHLSVHGQICDQFTRVGIGDHRTHGHAQHDVFGRRTITIGPLPMLAAFGTVEPGIPIIDQCVDVAVRHGQDRTTASAIATTGTPLGNKFFATKRHNAVAAIARMHLDRCFVYKFHQ